MRLLILAHAWDVGAQGVAGLLAPRLGPRLTVLRPEWLGQARWSQRLDRQGRARTVIRWHGGRQLESSQIGQVWNRIRLLPQAAFRASGARDQDYAGAELQALVASWLAELGVRVEPSMRHHAVVTPLLHRLHWMAVASRCGLMVEAGPGAREDCSLLRTPAHLSGPVADAWPEPLARACHALADELGFALLSLGFHGTPQAPRLCRVDTHPDLSTAGEMQAVAAWLSHRVDESAVRSAPDLTEALS